MGCTTATKCRLLSSSVSCYPGDGEVEPRPVAGEFRSTPAKHVVALKGKGEKGKGKGKGGKGKDKDNRGSGRGRGSGGKDKGKGKDW